MAYVKLHEVISIIEEVNNNYAGLIQHILEHCHVVDVKEERHGEWVETKEWYYDEVAQSNYQRKCYKCSICKRTEMYKEPYCHCGAKMDKVDGGSLNG